MKRINILYLIICLLQKYVNIAIDSLVFMVKICVLLFTNKIGSVIFKSQNYTYKKNKNLKIK